MATNNVLNDSSGIMQLTDGTAAAPSYTFSSDLDNGLYRVSENILGITTAGTQIAFFNTTTLNLLNNSVLKLTATSQNTSATITGAQLFGGLITGTGGGAITYTLDTAANIYTAMGSPGFVGAAFMCKVVSNSGTNITIATNTGLTLVLGATTVNNDSREYFFVVTNTSTPTISVYGG